MAKRRKADTDLPSLEERASMAFIHTALGRLDEVAAIEKTVPRVLSREPDARYRKRFNELVLAAYRWGLMRLRGELELCKVQRKVESGGAPDEALAEIAHIESYLLSCEAGLEDAAREHKFEADAARALTQLLPRFTASRPDAVLNEETRRLAAKLIHDVMSR